MPQRKKPLGVATCRISSTAEQRLAEWLAELTSANPRHPSRRPFGVRRGNGMPCCRSLYKLGRYFRFLDTFDTVV